MNRTKPIQGELLELKNVIESHAINYGLDFYPVVFEECDYDTINILAAQGGFPSRYPHWKFGLDYDQLSKGYAYGVQKIYEMVINTDPCYAYLLKANNLVDQKTVMAHVYGHADFFKNNYWFSGTNRKMMDVMANNGTKIRRYMNRYGQDRVESFIDKVLSLENLLDHNLLFEKRKKVIKVEEEEYDEYEGQSEALKSFFRSKKRYENEKNPVISEIKSNEYTEIETLRDSSLPSRDILGFLMEKAPLEDWESDIVGMLREEAYYFLPQRMTKIMNEGWASYWHSTIMTKNALNPSEVIDFADHHAGVMAMSRQQINPYKIGIELFRDIEYRWDTGKFGKDYNDCEDMTKKLNWNTQTNLGRKKIFEIRKTHNDITFIDEFLTEEFCQRQNIFTYKFNPRTNRHEVDSREFKEIKSKLLNQLTNSGNPVIEIVDSNFSNRGELLLKHVHYGVDLDYGQACETLKNISNLWKRPCVIESVVEGAPSRILFDGQEVKTQKV
jgi:stage V sporulation protein R